MVATTDDGLDALVGALGEEAPEGGTDEEVDWVVGDVAAEFEKLGKDHIEDGKHHERAKEGPKVAENGTLVAEFEIRFGEFLQEDTIALVKKIRNCHNISIVPYFWVFQKRSGRRRKSLES